jgi:hypothetical protein
MRTGNAFWAVTFTASPEPECRLTLLDAGADEAVAELVVEALPWEESAAVPVEAMSAFRESMEAVPETWASSGGIVEGATLVLSGSFEVAGELRSFELSLPSPADVPASLARFLTALSTAAGAALVGGKSRRMLALLERWGRG